MTDKMSKNPVLTVWLTASASLISRFGCMVYSLTWVESIILFLVFYGSTVTMQIIFRLVEVWNSNGLYCL